MEAQKVQCKSLVLASTIRNLSPIVAFLKDNPDRNLIIVGESMYGGGSDQDGFDLPTRRTESIREFFVNNGISSERIVACCLGDDYPPAAGRRFFTVSPRA
ncbi:MAG: OmpA family protein [Candidatus Binatia bacterium]